MAKIKTSWKKLEKGVGFSKGCALLAPKKPPPLVPNSLITSCDATGPCAMTCSVTYCELALPSEPVTCTVCGSTSSTLVYGFRFWTTPCDTKTKEPTKHIGSRTHRRHR